MREIYLKFVVAKLFVKLFFGLSVDFIDVHDKVITVVPSAVSEVLIGEMWIAIMYHDGTPLSLPATESNLKLAGMLKWKLIETRQSKLAGT
ncbi:hypothetical protein [Paraburkholderia tropica]|uniref:hypothetical protein n=1 Tax=Paraburkholderia tropica TaxID=92647 RepID=UPI003D2B94A3